MITNSIYETQEKKSSSLICFQQRGGKAQRIALSPPLFALRPHTVSQHHSFVSGVLFMRIPASLPTRMLLEWL